MKLLILPILFLLAGCYSPATYPLQPGEKIIFRDAARANEFRRLAGQDAYRAGSVVEIDRPAALTCE
jgi:hypothetical protein